MTKIKFGLTNSIKKFKETDLTKIHSVQAEDHPNGRAYSNEPSSRFS